MANKWHAFSRRSHGIRLHSPCSEVRMLVEVPFTLADVPLLLRSQSAWSHFSPCVTPQGVDLSSKDMLSARHRRADGHRGPGPRHGHGLLFLFNHQCVASSNCSRVIDYVELEMPRSVRACFNSILVHDALLRGTADMYDKKQRSKRWTAGPNNMFHRAVEIARQFGYSHMMQVEPDVIPFRAGWLDEAACIAQHSPGAWSLVHLCKQIARRRYDQDVR